MDAWTIQNGGAVGRISAGRYLPSVARLPCHFFLLLAILLVPYCFVTCARSSDRSLSLCHWPNWPHGLTALFALLALGDATGNETITKLAGWVGLFCGTCAIYSGLAQVLNEVYGKTVWPLGPMAKR